MSGTAVSFLHARCKCEPGVRRLIGAHPVQLYVNERDRLRRGCLFRHDAHVVIGDLKKTTFDMEPMSHGVTQTQLSVSKHGHHRGVTSQNSDFAVERRCYYRICLALEQHALG